MFREVSQVMNDTAAQANNGDVDSQLVCFGMGKPQYPHPHPHNTQSHVLVFALQNFLRIAPTIMDPIL